MKKRLLTIGVMLLIGLFLVAGCGGSSGDSQSSSSGSSSQSTSQSADNSSGSDSSSSSASKDNSTGSDTSSNSSGTTQSSTSSTGAANVIGDWQYEGMIDSGSYEINLDLEGDSRFELDIDQDTEAEDMDSKATGTYVSDDKSIILSIATVQDTNGYFTGAVVQNEQVTLDYTLSDDGRSLTLTNAPDSIAILPGELVLYRD